jgi:hypothetical protein
MKFLKAVRRVGGRDTDIEIPFSESDNGGSQTYVIASLQSSDGPNQSGTVPVLTPQGNIALTMPLSAYGAGGNIRVTLTNNSGADVKAGGTLVGLDAAGNLMERDTSGDQVVADGAADRIDFDSDGGGAVVGLAWNGTDKQIDVTGNGPFAATVAIYVKPA